MKSAWVTGKRRIEIMEQDISLPDKDEVLVKIKACGICGTDLHFYNDYPRRKPTPLGHEVSGMVEAAGSEIKDLKKGDRVIVQNHIPCGKCTSCLNGEHHFCENISTYMNDQSGMAEYLKVKRRMVLPFESFDYVEATIAEPLTVALDLCREANFGLYEEVLISGPGIIGLSCIKIAQLQGVRRIVVLGRGSAKPRGKKRLEIARSMGAQAVFDTDEPEWKNEILRDFPKGFKRIIVTSPPQTIPETFDIASFGATVVFNGISFKQETITFNANSFHFKKLRLIASHAMPNWGFPKAFNLLADKIINYRELVTHTFPLEKVKDAFLTAVSQDTEVVKVVVTL